MRLLPIVLLLWSGTTWGRWCGLQELSDSNGELRLALMPSSCAWVGLGGQRLSPKNLLDFSSVLASNATSLVHLGLGGNEIGDKGMEELGRGLAADVGLEWISLHSNGIGDRGAAALGRALANHSALRTVSLWENSIGDAGVAALAEALKTNPALEELSLALNAITDVGLHALAEALPHARNLKRLWLWGNPVSRDGVVRLASALGSDHSHVRLYTGEDDNGHPLCEAWADRNECAKNPTYMYSVCNSACLVSRDGAERRTAQQRKRTKTDGHPECPAWAMQAEGCHAETHKAYMWDLCAGSCTEAAQGRNTHPHAREL